MTTIESVDNDNSKLITVIMIQLINLKLCVIIIGELYELQRLQRTTQPYFYLSIYRQSKLIRPLFLLLLFIYFWLFLDY